MAGSFGSNSDEELISGINVTPLVDVILVLLIIFLMTAPIIYQSAIKVQLPQVKAATDKNKDKDSLIFTLAKNGELFWNSEKVNFDSLLGRLYPLAHHDPSRTAFISADEATPHGIVVRLMDILRQAGLSRFALNVDAAKS